MREIWTKKTPNMDTFNAVVNLSPIAQELLDFLAKIVSRFEPLTVFAKKLHHRYLIYSFPMHSFCIP